MGDDRTSFDAVEKCIPIVEAEALKNTKTS
jgi:hypothetical protein